MNIKGLILILVILIGGIILGNYGEKVFNFTDSKPVLSINKTEQESSPENLTNLQNSFSQVVKKAKPALVNISAVHIIEVQTPFHQFYFGDPFEEFFDDFFGRPRRRKQPKPEIEKYRYEGTGSGFIVDSKGYVITNYHVIKDAKEIKVTIYDDKKYDAEVIGKDPQTDLAVVKIKSLRKFNALQMGNSDMVKTGNWVMAAGSPFGLEQTYTAGIISAVRQNVNVENRAYRDMLQTDAAINRGNSGGPLLNLQGEVIGINTAIFAPTGVFSGIGFAIPINQAKKILKALIEKGRVVRGWLGVEIKDVDEAIKQQFELQHIKGVLVNKVIEGSGAQKGGIKRGDVIISINEAEIKNARDIQNKISDSAPETKVKLTIIRNGQEKVLEIKLGERPSEISDISKKKKDSNGEAECKGIKVAGINEIIKNRFNIAVSEGVVVVEIDPAKECYEIGLHIGDVIIELNRTKIHGTADFKNAFEKTDLKKGVVFDIIRNGRPMYLSYRKTK